MWHSSWWYTIVDCTLTREFDPGLAWQVRREVREHRLDIAFGCGDGGPEIA